MATGSQGFQRLRNQRKFVIKSESGELKKAEFHVQVDIPAPTIVMIFLNPLFFQ